MKIYTFTSQLYELGTIISGGVIQRTVALAEYNTTAFSISGLSLGGSKWQAQDVDPGWGLADLSDYILIDSTDTEYTITSNGTHQLIVSAGNPASGTAQIKEGDIKVELTVDNAVTYDTILDTATDTDNLETEYLLSSTGTDVRFIISLTVPDQAPVLVRNPTETLTGHAPPGTEIDIVDPSDGEIVSRTVSNTKGIFSVGVPVGTYDLHYLGNSISQDLWVRNRAVGHGDYSSKFGDPIATAIVQHNDAASTQQIGDLRWGQVAIFDSFDNETGRDASLDVLEANVLHGRCTVGFGTYVGWITFGFDPTLYTSVLVELSDNVEEN